MFLIQKARNAYLEKLILVKFYQNWSVHEAK
jgi:hypothetical protein